MRIRLITLTLALVLGLVSACESGAPATVVSQWATETPLPGATALPASTPILTETASPTETAVPEEEIQLPANGLIAFYSDRDGNPEIYVTGVDGSGAARLTSDPAFDDSPAISPDGMRIAFLTAQHDPNPQFPEPQVRNLCDGH